MNNNKIISDILNKMSKIESFFETFPNDENDKSNQKLIHPDLITNTFNAPAPIGKRTSAYCNREQKPNLPDRKKLFVGNLPSRTTLAELIQVFKVFGPINEQLSVVKEDNYAFIHFLNENDAEKAYKAMNDSFFKNRYIRVQYSTSQGHMKKSKTFETSNRLTESASCFTLSHQQGDHYSSFASINESTDFNRLINSQSFAAFNDSSLLNAQMRPITRRSMTRSSFNDYDNHYYTNNSLLMPAYHQQQSQHSTDTTSNYDMFFGSNRFSDFSLLCSLSDDKENTPQLIQSYNKVTFAESFEFNYINN